MPTYQDQNMDEWANLNQAEYTQPSQQYAYVPESYDLVQQGYYDPVDGYFPVQGYAPAGSQHGSSNGSDSSFQAEEDDDYDPEEEIDFVPTQPQRKRKSPAPPQNAQPQSKRAAIRRKVASENHGQVSATDSAPGLVEWHQGVFCWWDPVEHEWRRAAYHDQFRDEFIMADAMEEGAYVVAPARGKADNDITSPCSSFNQLEWRLSERNTWSNIVDAEGNEVLYALEKPMNQTHHPPGRLWEHSGCVLLDGDNNPVRPWFDIPRCFSSKLEGGRMEALRRILPMTIQDFRARMPRFVPTSKGLSKPLSYPSTFGHRSSRFRAQYQVPAWATRAASDILKNQVLDQLLPQGDEEEEEEATMTTEGLPVLTKEEVERRKSATRGRYLYKANGRALSDEERREREKKLNEKLARQAKNASSSRGRGGPPPQSMPATPGPSALSNPHLPTPPASTGNNKRRWKDVDVVDDGLEYFDYPEEEPAAKRTRRGGTSSIDPCPQPQHQHPPPPPLFSDQFPPALPNAPAAATTTTTTIDYRFHPPSTPLQQLRIQSALFYPRAHYYSLVGDHPPHTNSGTYADQYLQIVALLEQKWLVGGEVPELADVGPWTTGSFDVVPMPALDEGVVGMILNPFVVACGAGLGSEGVLGSSHLGGGGSDEVKEEEEEGSQWGSGSERSHGSSSFVEEEEEEKEGSEPVEGDVRELPPATGPEKKEEEEGEKEEEEQQKDEGGEQDIDAFNKDDEFFSQYLNSADGGVDLFEDF